MSKKRIGWIASSLAVLLLLSVPITNWTRAPCCSIILQPQKTGITTLHFFDETRQRPVTTEVWYPVDAQAPSKPSVGFWIRCEESRDAPLIFSEKKHPLIILSHGNGGDRFNLSWLAEILATNGYIVASMDHYGNTWNNKIPKSYAQPWERPKDISFVISEMLAHSLFQNHIDEAKIGFAGYSLGGATGMWIAGGQLSDISFDAIKEFCVKEMPDIVTADVIADVNFQEARHSYWDERVSAVLAIAPALGWMFDDFSLKSIHIPIYIIAAAKDKITPLEKNAKRFSEKISKATLKVFNNDSGHYTFLNRASLIGKRVLESKFCEDPASVDRRQVHEDVGKTAVQFFDETLQ